MYKVTVWATDGRGGVDYRNVTVTVTDVAEVFNRAPAIRSRIGTQTIRVGTSKLIDLSTRFSDPDSDPLTYTATSSNTGVVTATVNGSTLTLSPVSTGSADVTVSASDRRLNVAQAFS